MDLIRLHCLYRQPEHHAQHTGARPGAHSLTSSLHWDLLGLGTQILNELMNFLRLNVISSVRWVSEGTALVTSWALNGPGYVNPRGCCGGCKNPAWSCGPRSFCAEPSIAPHHRSDIDQTQILPWKALPMRLSSGHTISPSPSCPRTRTEMRVMHRTPDGRRHHCQQHALCAPRL